MPGILTKPKKGMPVAVDFRKLIKDRIEKLGMSKYQLSERLKGKPSRNALYTYLRGDTDMGGDNIARILEILDNEEKRR